ncbi:MAG: HNH endonuclease [Bacteroidales bacterium]|nr:HNH endonuclease [Bacteroidales bacterium]
MLEIFDREIQCEYRDRDYLVRDNGAILRLPKEGVRKSKWDNVWTFGNKDEKTGYMIFTGNVRVHQVVCTAFHGPAPELNMVVDHIDTNRCNNRPENLRWVTRLENVLNNPITRKRIIIRYGSVEIFLNNPSILRDDTSDPNFKWMRTVTKEEASKCRKNLERWAKEDSVTVPKGVGLDERIYNESSDDFGETWDKDWASRDTRSEYQIQKELIEEENRQYYEKEYGLKDSLTPGALQLNWKVPSEFPLCPAQNSSAPLQDYFENLKAGEVFCRNDIYESIVFKADISCDGQKLVVISSSEGVKGGPGYTLCLITFMNGLFIHKNGGSFFEEIGAEEHYTIALGHEWTEGEVPDDFC